jgi:hypothetical protein
MARPDVALPIDELRAAFAPAGPSRKSSGSAPADHNDHPGQDSILRAAEAYATRFREQQKYQRYWAEGAPVTVRALFRAIRENTPSGRVRDSATAGPYRHDPTLPQLTDLSADLRTLLDISWPVWDSVW